MLSLRSRMVRAMDADKKTGYLRCPKCGETYSVKGKDLITQHRTHTCNKCGSSISIDYFVYCPHCEKIVGLDNTRRFWGERAKKMGKEFLKISFIPYYYLKPITRHLDKKYKPYDHGHGACPFCDTSYALCPNCHSAVEVGSETKPDDILFCTECGQKFRKQ